MSMKVAISFWELMMLEGSKTKSEYKDLFAKMSEEDKLDVLNMSDLYRGVCDVLWCLMLDSSEEVRKTAHKAWSSVIDYFSKLTSFDIVSQQPKILVQNAPYDELKRIIDEGDISTCIYIARESHDRNIMKYLINISNEDVIITVIDNLCTATSTLQSLVQSENVNIRRAIASKKHGAKGFEKILDQLSKDSDVEVRVKVAGNYYTSDETLTEMCKDESDEVKMKLASCPWDPLYKFPLYAYVLANDKNPEIRKKLAESLTTNNISGLFTNDDSVEVRMAAAGNEYLDSDDLLIYASDSDIRVKRVVAGMLQYYCYIGDKTIDEVASILAKENDAEILASLEKKNI